MKLDESVSLLRQATTLAEVLEGLADKSISHEAIECPVSNVVSLTQYRKQKQLQEANNGDYGKRSE